MAGEHGAAGDRNRLILPAAHHHLPIPGRGLAVIVVQNPDPSCLARSTSLMRMSEGQFDMLTAGRWNETGQPMYWTVRADGTGVVWPPADRNYTLRARDAAGRDPDAVRKPVSVFPVAETVEAVNRLVAEAREKESAARTQPVAEYFRRPMGEADE